MICSHWSVFYLKYNIPIVKAGSGKTMETILHTCTRMQIFYDTGDKKRNQLNSCLSPFSNFLCTFEWLFFHTRDQKPCILSHITITVWAGTSCAEQVYEKIPLNFGIIALLQLIVTMINHWENIFPNVMRSVPSKLFSFTFTRKRNENW